MRLEAGSDKNMPPEIEIIWSGELTDAWREIVVKFKVEVFTVSEKKSVNIPKFKSKLKEVRIGANKSGENMCTFGAIEIVTARLKLFLKSERELASIDK